MWVAEQGAARIEGIEPTRLPGCEKARERHPGLAAAPAAGAAADRASDDEGAQAPLGEVVVGFDARGTDELKELAVEPQQPFGQRLAGMAFDLSVAQPELSGALLELREEALAFGFRQRGAAGAAQGGLGLVIQLPNRLGPALHLLVGRVLLPQFVQIPQQMHPAALVLAVDGVATHRRSR